MQNNVRKIRESLGLTLDQVAREINTTKAQISKLERGLIRLNDKWLGKLSVVFGCSIHDLIDDELAKIEKISPAKRRDKKAFITCRMLGIVDATQVGEVIRSKEEEQYTLAFSYPKKLENYLIRDSDIYGFILKNAQYHDMQPDTQLIFARVTNANKKLVKNGSIILCTQKDRKGNVSGEAIRRIEFDDDKIPYAVYAKKNKNKKILSNLSKEPLLGEDSLRKLVEIYHSRDIHPKSKAKKQEIHLKNDTLDIKAVLVKTIRDE